MSLLAVGLLPPETAIVEHDLTPVDVIAKPEAAEGEAPLALADRDTYELPDMLCPAAVVGVGLQNIEGSVLQRSEFGMD